MKKIKIITYMLLSIIIISISTYGFNNGNIRGKGFGQNQGGQMYQFFDDTQVNHQMQINTYPMETLTEEEINGLTLMREEEKLARDVYTELYNMWGQQIFSNIAASENTHTEAMKFLLEKYNLEDPAGNDIEGTFQNQNLQNLYNQFITQGSNSLIDALKVSATIEDLDIRDLQELKKTVDNEDITAVYNNLERASRNHLRSFVKNIEINDDSYTPQYITEEYYNSIMSTDIETGTQYNPAANMPNQTNQTTQQQNMFTRMWKAFKGWFS